ncbi:VWA domain-containing protein [Candidatus Micrarchaeota archaeon]|nr:VWA domain-containing protein [Candidatus Micrarchaeota archaeon]
MDRRIILLGIMLILFGSVVKAASLSGSCSSTNVQCELSLNDLKLCNDSGKTHTYHTSAQGEFGKWITVIPGDVTLSPGECRELRVYTIAECYAEPGTYHAQVVVTNDISAKVDCTINIEQGHFVDVKITPKEQHATQCEAKEYDVTLTNRSTVSNQKREDIRLEINGLTGGWFTLGKTEFGVYKGTPEHTSLRVQAPCDAELGSYEFDAVAYLKNPKFFSADNAAYILGQGQNFEIDAQNEYTACIEEATEGSLTITNTGKLNDDVMLEFSGPDWAGISTNRLALDIGESREITLDFRETNAQPGVYEASIIAKSENFDYVSTRNFEIELKDCYNLVLEKISGEKGVCAEDNVNYKFRLTNNAEKTVDATLNLSGISATLSKAKVSLTPGQSTTIDASLDVLGEESGATVNQRDVAIDILMDTSGSMVEKVNGHNKMDAAKNAISSFVNNIADVELGLRVFGQGKDCEDSELLAQVSGGNISEIAEAIEGMKPRGKTPVAQALNMAVADLEGSASNKTSYL